MTNYDKIYEKTIPIMNLLRICVSWNLLENRLSEKDKIYYTFSSGRFLQVAGIVEMVTFPPVALRKDCRLHHAHVGHDPCYITDC